MPTPHTGTALTRSRHLLYSTRFYFYPLLLTNHFNRNRKLQLQSSHPHRRQTTSRTPRKVTAANKRTTCPCPLQGASCRTEVPAFKPLACLHGSQIPDSAGPVTHVLSGTHRAEIRQFTTGRSECRLKGIATTQPGGRATAAGPFKGRAEVRTIPD